MNGGPNANMDAGPPILLLLMSIVVVVVGHTRLAGICICVVVSLSPIGINYMWETLNFFLLTPPFRRNKANAPTRGWVGAEQPTGVQYLVISISGYRPSTKRENPRKMG
jgi:hypothetical protein